MDYLKEKGYCLSGSTLHREFVRNEIQRVTAWNHPPLTETQRVERLEWCFKHRYDPFEKDIWTDEKLFHIGEKRTKFLKKRSDPIPGVVKFGRPVSLMVFGGISRKGTTSIVRIQGNLNGELYREILEGPFFKSALKLFPNGDWRLTQDNARPHVARATMNWIYNNMPPPLDHVPNSPDLNKIEELWSILINWVEQQHPRTKEELWAAIKWAWQRVTPHLCNKIIDIMYSTLDVIIEANGQYTTPA